MIPLAGNRPCLNGGACTDGIGHPICACPAPLASDDAGDICTNECGPSPCLNGGVCTDGIGSFICYCAPGFCGPTCADLLDPSQNGGRCCEDDPAWVDTQFFGPEGRVHHGGLPAQGPAQGGWNSRCSDLTFQRCSPDWNFVDAAGVTAQDACPVTCQSGCLLTYDDCCALTPQSPSTLRVCFIIVFHFSHLCLQCSHSTTVLPSHFPHIPIIAYTSHSSLSCCSLTTVATLQGGTTLVSTVEFARTALARSPAIAPARATTDRHVRFRRRHRARMTRPGPT